ncbi:hypothetical protein DMENIID0001_129070 [Sergentomyia squamirostris]
MDFIDLNTNNEIGNQEASAKAVIVKLPPPLLPSVEDFQGRLSVSGDPFEKMMSQVALADDPFECLTRIRSSPGHLVTNFTELETFFQNDVQIFSPNYIANSFLSCDISPIVDVTCSDQPSVFNHGFLLSSKNSISDKTPSGSDEKDEKSDEVKDRSVTGTKLPEKQASPPVWQCVVMDDQGDIMLETPPLDMCETDDEEDSLEQMKIPMLEQLQKNSKTEEEIPEPPEYTETNTSVLNTSAVVDDLRRRMKDVMNKRISPATPELKRDKTFDIDPSKSIVKKTEPEGKDEDSADTFMEKLKEMCCEHNVSVVENSENNSHNKSMIVVLINDTSKNVGSQLQRRKSFSNEIPRLVVDAPPKRRRSVTSGPSGQKKPETPKKWQPPVGRALPSPQFRGKALKIRTTEASKMKVTGSGPMRAIRPQTRIQADENITPPERIVSKRRSLVTTSTPKLNLNKSPVPQHKFPTKTSMKKTPESGRHLLETNKLNPRVSFSSK